MNKIKIFIDFEVISPPFSYKLKTKSNTIPYAYSFGLKIKNKFNKKTTIINFKKLNSKSLDNFIKNDITKTIRLWIKKPKFVIKKSNTEFIGWNPDLEVRILRNIFKTVEIQNQSPESALSLSRLTKIKFKEKIYFKTLKNNIQKFMDEEFIKRRGLTHDGAVAAYAGYVYYSKNLGLETKWKTNIKINNLLSEIKTYSQDDLMRMIYLEENPQSFEKEIIKLKKIYKKKKEVSRKITQNTKIINILSGENPKMKISDLIKKLKENTKKLTKEKDRL